ncbi:Glycosyltransferase involved in cell wall bisynthesis [Lacrimispora sphenoides]|jgi:glycosyltransferase involved in cell wall biosynthesis|uniref:glycosyltransferase family 4 protein n=1 Tax=Lacrimispora sphenoides TaxID=29370 RepID=UPI0008B0E5F6|nr:glycosyltransferase family 4 protein [Lacrimispora sphenoides]SET90469.1 Glycosyltransferase involved in cell wall bisynthesis [Lacrimispora sphenoides]
MKNKKALLVTTVSGFVPQFEMANVRILQEMGYEIHYAANYNYPSYGNDNHRLDGTGIIQHQVDFARSPFKSQNVKAYKQLKRLMTTEDFGLIHCHTPMGGVLSRLAAHKTKTAPVVYTAHGFHFYSGAPLVNWLLYYPVEKLLSFFTDELICINKEDYKRAKKKFHARNVDYIPGVGINLERVQKTVEVLRKREELGIPEGKVILLSSGELIKRKNHEAIIWAIAQLKNSTMDFHYVICGHGVLEKHLHQLAKELQVLELVSFLGYREDMSEILQIADVFLFPSIQEGLPMAMLEAMAYGLPVICSDIRGSRDLMGKYAEHALDYCAGGIVVKSASDVLSYGQAIRILMEDRKMREEMGEKNRLCAKEFSDQYVKKDMCRIYSRLLL